MSFVPVITIDGPSGSGKGTVSRVLAQDLKFHYLDSGALYRAVGLAASKRNIALDDEIQVVEVAKNLALGFKLAKRPEDDQVLLDGQDVSTDLRGEQVAAMASKVAAIPAVRDALLERQRKFAQAPGLVADGRDMGTTVFPDAQLKLYLTASAEKRAQRRLKQLKEKGISANIAALSREIQERDARDAGRKASPLRAAADAVQIDTTDITVDEVSKIARMQWQAIASKMGG